MVPIEDSGKPADVGEHGAKDVADPLVSSVAARRNDFSASA